MAEYCCDALKQVMENWDGPFHRPVYIDQELHNLKADRFAVTLFNLTPSGKGISRKGRNTLFLSYCPICGTRLDDD